MFLPFNLPISVDLVSKKCVSVSDEEIKIEKERRNSKRKKM